MEVPTFEEETGAPDIEESLIQDKAVLEQRLREASIIKKTLKTDGWILIEEHLQNKIDAYSQICQTAKDWEEVKRAQSNLQAIRDLLGCIHQGLQYGEQSKELLNQNEAELYGGPIN